MTVLLQTQWGESEILACADSKNKTNLLLMPKLSPMLRCGAAEALHFPHKPEHKLQRLEKMNFTYSLLGLNCKGPTCILTKDMGQRFRFKAVFPCRMMPGSTHFRFMGWWKLLPSVRWLAMAFCIESFPKKNNAANPEAFTCGQIEQTLPVSHGSCFQDSLGYSAFYLAMVGTSGL